MTPKQKITKEDVLEIIRKAFIFNHEKVKISKHRKKCRFCKLNWKLIKEVNKL